MSNSIKEMSFDVIDGVGEMKVTRIASEWGRLFSKGGRQKICLHSYVSAI
jgi:hypothetical protein